MANRDSRTSREQEQRDKLPTREQESNVVDFDEMFGPGQSLKAPKARAGFVQRWVRAEIGGKSDDPKVAQQRQKGWIPRPASTCAADNPEFADYAQTDEGHVRVRGMILMERPVELHEKHVAWNRQRTHDLMSRVHTDLNDSKQVIEGMRPYVEQHKQSVTVKKAQPVAVADDD